MIETPANSISLPLSALRTMLSECGSFQTLVGASSAAAALPYIRFFGVDRPRAWSALTACALGDFVIAGGEPGFVFECTAAGTSAAAEPTWPAVAGGTVVDGSVTWTARARQGEAYNTVVRELRPFALVGQGRDFRISAAGRGGVTDYDCSGAILLFLEVEVPAAYSAGLSDAGLWFANLAGAILDDLRALGGSPGYLNVTGFELQEFQRSEPKDIEAWGDCFQAVISVQWGGG